MHENCASRLRQCFLRGARRYCDEFSFRWSNRKTTDGVRTEAAIVGSAGKRLLYRKSA